MKTDLKKRPSIPAQLDVNSLKLVSFFSQPGSVLEWNQCIGACPECLRQCELTQGHYDNHRCSEGHRWL